MRSTSNEVYQFSSVSGIASALMFATTASSPPSRSAAAVDPRPQRGAVPDVEPGAAHPGPPVGERLLGRLDLRGVPRAELHDGALVDELLDDRPADAAGAAGDEHPRAAQLQVHVRSPRIRGGTPRGCAARRAARRRRGRRAAGTSVP